MLESVAKLFHIFKRFFKRLKCWTRNSIETGKSSTHSSEPWIRHFFIRNVKTDAQLIELLFKFLHDRRGNICCLILDDPATSIRLRPITDSFLSHYRLTDLRVTSDMVTSTSTRSIESTDTEEKAYTLSDGKRNAPAARSIVS